VGVAKPDPRIYEILFACVGRPASELLFIDDSIANVRASEAAGMAAIHYRPGCLSETQHPSFPAEPCPRRAALCRLGGAVRRAFAFLRRQHKRRRRWRTSKNSDLS
jgi:hypothetical protein